MSQNFRYLAAALIGGLAVPAMAAPAAPVPQHDRPSTGAGPHHPAPTEGVRPMMGDSERREAMMAQMRQCQEMMTSMMSMMSMMSRDGTPRHEAPPQPPAAPK